MLEWQKLFLLLPNYCMLFRLVAVCTIICICVVHRAQAQVSNYRVKWVKRSEQWKEADSLSLFSASIQLVYPAGAALPFTYNSQKNTFQWNSQADTDSVLISYRVLPFRIGQPRHHRDPASYDSNAFYKEERLLGKNLPETREEFLLPKALIKQAVLPVVFL